MRTKDELRQKIAITFKQRRKQLGFSQKELAEGVCAQGIISKIEKNELLPSIEIIIKVVHKLKIPKSFIDDLFNFDDNTTFYSSEVKDLLKANNYSALNFIVSKTNDVQLSPVERLYYDWIKAVVLYHYKHNKKEAMFILNNLLERTESDNPVHVKAQMMIGNIYSNDKKYTKAISIFEDILPKIAQLTEWEEGVRLYYNLAQAYFLTDNFDLALKYVSFGIDLTVLHQSMYLLGDSYLMRAQLLKEKNFENEALDAAQKAISIFTIQNNSYLVSMALNFLSTLK
ncbi:helix-turn-helix domain-containing protein [Carnobacteriaceae bacterium zg-ZUI78]|nr:helix-turn-helix domain-containing protein [Carnobacteriaceae bacterium zg-ZUI78]